MPPDYFQLADQPLETLRTAVELDAVDAAVRVLEDDPLPNVGRCSPFAADGTNAMDAALMDGVTLAAGSVADVRFAIIRARKQRTVSPAPKGGITC